MKLTKQERNDPLWLKIKSELDARLAQLRTGNDRDMSDTETAKHRGRIAEVKKFLDIGEEKPVIEVE